jgi:hypothetical protein
MDRINDVRVCAAAGMHALPPFPACRELYVDLFVHRPSPPPLTGH